MTTMNIFDMADTWNDAGTTFTAIKMNVTDTASAAGSKLVDLLVAGVSKFNVGVNGGVVGSSFGNQHVVSSGFYGIGIGATYTAIYANKAHSGQPGFQVDATGVHIGTYSGLAALTFAPAYAALNPDLYVRRDDANTLALRNGVNGQAFRLYNTYTDASNYERAFMRWNSNVLEVGSEAAGTGSTRATAFTDAAISMANLPTSDPAVAGRLWSNTGVVTVSAG